MKGGGEERREIFVSRASVGGGEANTGRGSNARSAKKLRVGQVLGTTVCYYIRGQCKQTVYTGQIVVNHHKQCRAVENKRTREGEGERSTHECIRSKSCAANEPRLSFLYADEANSSRCRQK